MKIRAVTIDVPGNLGGRTHMDGVPNAFGHVLEESNAFVSAEIPAEVLQQALALLMPYLETSPLKHWSWLETGEQA